MGGEKNIDGLLEHFEMMTLLARHIWNELQRLDGRQTYDFRKIKLTFGTEFGHVEVQLGQTRYVCVLVCWWVGLGAWVCACVRVRVRVR